MRRLAAVLPGLAVLCVGRVLPAQTPSPRRGVTAEDYFGFTFAADPRISPDGGQVAYVSSRIDRARNRRVPAIWVVPTDGSSAPRQVVDETWSASAPRWSPDGKTLAFISSRLADTARSSGTQPAATGRPQLWTIRLGQTPRVVSHVANGVSGCSWSPNGAQFVCLSRTGPSDTLNTGPERSDVRHYSSITYKFNDTGWYDD
ncbi:MAG TPA: hypothetical protein VM076_23730, partial [Gemmatimonadaceae bacterium]|nr:hypothetical protein [Gemmatimonadaceae bacterium]